MTTHRQSPRRRPAQGVSAAARALDEARTPVQFLAQLDALRKSLGLSYTQIGEKAGKGMSRSTAQAVVNGTALPSRKQLQLFLTAACQVSPEEYALWQRAWDRLREAAAKQPEAPAPEPEPEVEQPEPPRAPQPRIGVGLVSLAIVLVVVVTASAVAMQLAGVPLEVMLSVYAVVVIATLAWARVATTAVQASAEHLRRYPYEDDVVGPPSKAAPPVIGL